MKRMAPSLALVIGLTTSGCLQKDTVSTIYLRPDGSLDWVVSERNVRSDEADPAKRAAEESSYLEAIARDEHGPAMSFRGLSGSFVRTRLLRDTRPYEVTTDARFSGLSEIVDRALTACGIPHRVDSTTDNGVTAWRLWADLGEQSDNATEGDSDACEDATAGLTDWGQFSIRLESGWFMSATGFTIESPDTVILDETLGKPDHLEKNNGQITLSLSWTDRAPVSAPEGLK